MENHPFLFVYGTLKRNFDNPFADLLRDHAEFIAEGFFNGQMFLCEWYPAAIYNPTLPTHVHGEVYQLIRPELVLPSLDEYEEINPIETESLYLRKIVPVTLQDKSLIPCQVYLYNQSTAELLPIPSGIFLKKR